MTTPPSSPRATTTADVPHCASRFEPGRPLPEVVLLGASNVSWNFGTFVKSLAHALPEGFRLFAAHGHGRSFGMKSRVLVRQLQGHTQSQLWSHWESRRVEGASRYALVTDVGNDLLFGVSVEVLLGWVGECLQRLRDGGCELAISTPPVDVLTSLSTVRYSMTSRLFFPANAIPWTEMEAKIYALDDGLRNLASQHDAAVIEPDARWYGFDPIHFRRSRRGEAVAALLGGWPSLGLPSPAIESLGEAIPLWRLNPARKWLAGRLIETPQPARVTDQYELSLF